MKIKESKQILIAGDSVFFRISLSSILSKIGHKVSICKSGIEVMEKIKEEPGKIDLLICDMQNININGYAVLEQLQTEPDVKPSILCITGAYDISHNLEHLKELGVNGVLTKGFSPEQIVFRINRQLFKDKICDREEQRVPVSLALDFSIGTHKYTSFMLNISATGLFLYSKQELLHGTLIQIQFVLPGTKKVMDLKGIVRWSTQPGLGDDYFNGAGVLFTSITDSDKQNIRAFVEDELKKIEPGTGPFC